jgi:ATP-binding cassette, subfamily F, member 3
MTTYAEFIKAEFPRLDDELLHYVDGACGALNWSLNTYFDVYFVAGVLAGGADEFEDSEELYEAIGHVLEEVAEDKTESEIRCDLYYLDTNQVLLLWKYYH